MLNIKIIPIIAILSLSAGCELLPFNVDNAVNKAARVAAQAEAGNVFITTVETLTGSSENQIELHKQRKEGLANITNELVELYKSPNSSTEDKENIIVAITEAYDNHTTTESVLSIILIILGVVVLAMIYLLTRGINNFIKNRRSNQNIPLR